MEDVGEWSLSLVGGLCHGARTCIWCDVPESLCNSFTRNCSCSSTLSLSVGYFFQKARSEQAQYTSNPLKAAYHPSVLCTPATIPDMHEAPPTYPMLYPTKPKQVDFSNQFQIPAAHPPPYGTPSHNPNIPPLHLESLIRPIDRHLANIPQNSHKHRRIFIGLVHHADAARGIIQPLQAGRELRKERGGVVRAEQRLVAREVLVLRGRE